MRLPYILTLLLSLGCTATATSQSRPATGLIFDDAKVEKIPVKPRLLTRDYTAIPESVSLVPWCPIPQSQEQYGTCTSWASTYAARTIAEAINNGWGNRSKISAEAFAPIFIYAQIKSDDDYDCQLGSCIDDALETLMLKGAPKLADFNLLCATDISDDIYAKARQYVIDDYFQVFNIYSDADKKISATKKSLSEKRPVIIGMKVPDSFMDCYGKDLWNKTETNNDGGGHAMCIVGYDNNKYGGAFLIMNSWGTQWGNDGMIWVKYKDFADNVKYGFEMFLKKKETPKPGPHYANRFAGSIRFRLSTGSDMVPRLDRGVYQMQDPYISGTRYRIYLSNNEPAYVYVIGSDDSNEVSTVFPPDDKTSAALVYSSNDIALPDENWFIEMDDTRGTDNVCVLYSMNELPISDITASIEKSAGTFREKVLSVLGSSAVTNAGFAADNISFTAESNASVVPVFIQIRHI